MVLCFSFTSSERNTFLKSCFSKEKFYLIRLFENLLIGIPFIILLMINGIWLAALMIPIANCIIILFNNKREINYVLPTPFFKYPFEFLVGFRKTFFLILVMYAICVIAIIVGNFNLGLFSLIIIHLICVFFYLDLENYFYIWIHSLKSFDFLIKKIKIMLLYTSLLTLPILIALSLAFQNKFTIVVFVQIIGYISISASLLSKYAFFPNRIPLHKFIMFITSLVLVPLVVIFIPYFYVKSQLELKKILK